MSRLRQRWKLTGSALSSRVAQWTQRGVVRSIQSGSILLSGVTSNTASVTAVVPENCILLYGGSQYGTVDTLSSGFCVRLTLTNSTTITATRQSSSNVAAVSYVLIELVPGVIRSTQSGTVALNSVTSNTATVTAVVTAKSSLFYLGTSTDDTSGAGATFDVEIALTNSTTITATRASNSGSTVVSYLLVEWW